MRILISNDDGIDAPGLGLLRDAAEQLSADLWVVAPERKWTAASHQLSFDRKLVLTRRDYRVYALSGSPADCVVGAMTVLFRAAPRPDLVLSGVNDGRNVGEDAVYSGTLAVAREASFWGIPAVGLSRTKGASADAAARDALARLLGGLWSRRDAWQREGHWLSINLPKALPARIRLARISRDKIATAADILEETPDRTAWRIRRERSHCPQAGDENSVIDTGAIAIVRHCWHAGEPLSEAMLEDLDAEIAGTSPSR